MAEKVIGKNVMLYKTENNSKLFLNGSVFQGNIDGGPYYQLSGSQITGSSVDFTKVGNGTIAQFITDTSVTIPSLTASTWNVTSYTSLSGDLSGSPFFYYALYKYDGTTFTLIAESPYNYFSSNAKTLYTSVLTIPATTFAAGERLAIKAIGYNIGSRTATLFTQSSNPAQIQTNLPVEVPFACSTNCNFSVSVDQKEVTSQTSAWYREFKIDIATWNVTCDGLVTLQDYGYLFLLKQQQDRTPILIKFVIDNGANGLVIISGKVNLTSLSIAAPYKDIATYQVSLQGTGAYGTSGTTINSSGVIIAGGSTLMKQYVAAGGETTITFTDLIGNTCLYVSRGGVDVREILTTGTPVADQVKFDSTSGVLTFGRALESDEFIRGLFN